MTGLNWRELGFQNQDLQDYGGFTGLGRCWCIVFTLWSRVRHWDRLFDSSPIKVEGEYVGWFGLLLPGSPLDC